MINKPSKWMIAFAAIAIAALVMHASLRDRNAITGGGEFGGGGAGGRWEDSISNI